MSRLKAYLPWATTQALFSEGLLAVYEDIQLFIYLLHICAALLKQPDDLLSCLGTWL